MNSRPYSPFSSHFDLTNLFCGDPRNLEEVSSNPVNSRRRPVMEMSRLIDVNTRRKIQQTLMEMEPNPFDSLGTNMTTISPKENSGLEPTQSPRSYSETCTRSLSNSLEDGESNMSMSNHTEESYLPLSTSGRGIMSRLPGNNNYSLGEITRIVQEIVTQEIRSSKARIGCVFCKKNGETYEYYSTHILKDHKGKVICPVLRKYNCPICNATGDDAHTQRHCPVLQARQPRPWSHLC